MSDFAAVFCFIGQHSGGVQSDETGLWFQCAHCGRRSGFVPRAALDTMIDRDIAAQQQDPS